MKTKIRTLFRGIVKNYITAASWMFPYERVARDIDIYHRIEK